MPASRLLSVVRPPHVWRRTRLQPTHQISARSYQTYDRPAPPGPFSTLQTTILAASLPHVPHHGFTPHTLARGAVAAGYCDATTNLFSSPFALVHYHLRTQRQSLAAPAADATAQSSGESMRVLAWRRLLGNTPIIHRWSEALALAAQPVHLPLAMQELADLVDDIYFLAGDTAVDSSWYAKRIAFAGVYSATELFMMTDHSPGFRDTHDFLLRRCDELDVAGKSLAAVAEWSGFTARAALNVLRSKGLRV